MTSLMSRTSCQWLHVCYVSVTGHFVLPVVANLTAEPFFRSVEAHDLKLKGADQAAEFDKRVENVFIWIIYNLL